MENIPSYISILFIIITLVTVIWFYLTASKPKLFLGLALLWIALQTYLASSGFYRDFSVAPPRLGFAIIPTLILMFSIFLTKKGRDFIQKIDLEKATYLSVVRIPVEIVLALLYHQGAISIWQTFEGANFDILSGITAPIVAYMVFKKKKWGKNILLSWNIICLILLITIVLISTFAFPSPIQQLSFEQPNIAMAYFPFILLPGIVVPIVMFTHFISIYRILKNQV